MMPAAFVGSLLSTLAKLEKQTVLSVHDLRTPASGKKAMKFEAETGSTQDERFKFILNNMTVRRVEPTDRFDHAFLFAFAKP